MCICCIGVFGAGGVVDAAAVVAEGLPGGPCSLVPNKIFLMFPCSLKAFFFPILVFPVP